VAKGEAEAEAEAEASSREDEDEDESGMRPLTRSVMTASASWVRAVQRER
jgi:hypothetical protein